MKPRRKGGWATARDRRSIAVTVRAIAGSSGQVLRDRRGRGAWRSRRPASDRRPRPSAWPGTGRSASATVTPCGLARPAASARVPRRRPWTRCRRRGRRPAARPPPRRREAGGRGARRTCGSGARTVRQTPSRLTSSVSSDGLRGGDRSGPPVAIPALATATSIPPQPRGERVDLRRSAPRRRARRRPRSRAPRQTAGHGLQPISVDVDQRQPASRARRAAAGATTRPFPSRRPSRAPRAHRGSTPWAGTLVDASGSTAHNPTAATVVPAGARSRAYWWYVGTAGCRQGRARPFGMRRNFGRVH